jgi:hypothetical protein
MDRRERIRDIERAIGRRKLVWFGTRGADALPLLDVAQFRECYSLIAPLGSLALDREVCLEPLTGERVDLDTYTIDHDSSDAAGEMHRAMLRSLAEPCLVALYRPCAFFTSIYFARRQWVEYLGMFHERQAAFEHKPWVETELAKEGVRVLPWQYFPDEDRTRVLEALMGEPLVLRSSRSDGGVGLRVIREPQELLSQWPEHSDRFVAASPYFETNIPLNVGCCIFDDGSVSLHGPSLQLVGVPGLTTLRLGYCGNDFASIADLGDELIDHFEEVARGAGHWLAFNGYRGAYGVDALVHDGKVYLTEVNPRFQGSSAMSAELDRALDRPDIFLNHIAAFLHQGPPEQIPLRRLAREQPPRSQVITHNCGSVPVTVYPDASPADGSDGLPPSLQLQLQTAADIAVLPQAILFRAIVRGPVTTDGFSLEPQLGADVVGLVESRCRPLTSPQERIAP